MPKEGIETIKMAVGTALAIVETVHKATEDNKISFGETLGIAAKAFPIAEVIRKRKQLWDELRDLDEKEKTELHQWVAERFDIPQDRAEVTIEKSLIILLNLLNYSVDLAEIWKKQ